MIDIHTHILPCIDDGSKSMEMTLEMLRIQARQGVTDVVLTPHFYADQNSPEEFLQRRNRAYAKVRRVLEPGMPRLHLGAEVQYFEGICQVDDLNRMCVDGGRYLLLEMPFSDWSRQMVSDAISLNSRSEIQVILAHIERYFRFTTPDVWQELREQGVWMQSNSSFFLNWKTRHRALNMFREGQIQFIASDCHNLTTRPPDLAQAWEYVHSKIPNM